ncbi:hypothetical protein A1O3_04013 [Capronia epimyces CBS 606.96]|uniref:Uncharacterized protein n=1 Tax=Capronia epimyces CBS 606.96 TaxID=1182542 RepID=W9YCS8_9EURO|nr:uncharacterized protein A1O3_04013 [Capronia epimyces CBS 606.96]EXJ87056.1 hypothetical protein A1O3_04013 [Capronia epimyces CBS 606.96]
MSKVSHGRGGAANIAPDDTPYVDGAIVREGLVGNQGDGPYSAGRGGAGNIDTAGEPTTAPHDSEIIPETATRVAKEESHHVGRGGAGNEAHVHDKKHEGLADKLKHFFIKRKS